MCSNDVAKQSDEIAPPHVRPKFRRRYRIGLEEHFDRGCERLRYCT
jgi:hypothetical protein